MIRKKVPLVSLEQYSEARKKQGTVNKDRSKSMEREIAKYLRGRRVPMSGAAAAYKGDVEIEFENNPGRYLIECKLSAATSQTGEKTIRIDYRWLDKHQKDTEAMRAKFGVFIFHYLGQDYSRDFVFVRLVDVQQLFIEKYNTPYKDTLIDLLSITENNKYDLRYQKNGRIRTGYNLQRKEIEDRFMSSSAIKAVRVIMSTGEFLVFTLKDYRDILEHL